VLVRWETLRRTRLADIVPEAQDVHAPRWGLAEFVEYQMGRGLKSRGFLGDLEER
jgi:hypothetical protein